jgi:hypothetical protein
MKRESRSFPVGMGYTVCPITGRKEEAVIIGEHAVDKDKSDLGKDNFLGFEICKEAQEKLDAGYIALIEVNNAGTGKTLKNEEADRTGNIAYMKKEAFNQIFMGLPEDAKNDMTHCFIDVQAMNEVTNMYQYSINNNNQNE